MRRYDEGRGELGRVKTPILDFIKAYNKKRSARFHMPGHKGKRFIFNEKYDITEISGADVLYSPSGIILESENNLSSLFGTAHSFYSTEGASLVIRTMLAILKKHSPSCEILATRNAHKSFLYACALLDIEPVFIGDSEGICECLLTKSKLDEYLSKTSKAPMALYVTSPDYLGNLADIKGIGEICKKHGILLLVDNAHGAYLNFLKPNLHPIALGADMVADSAHKTLPTLTGGAYLHISNSAPCEILDGVRDAFSLFASTSPSYLILASLDKTNAYLHSQGIKEFEKCRENVEKCKQKITKLGFSLLCSEPLKICILPNSYGYTGYELSKYLSKHSVECEYADKTHLVLMCTPKNKSADYKRLVSLLSRLERRDGIEFSVPKITACKRELSICNSLFSPSEKVKAEDSENRICASVSVSCPPAIPIVIAGEKITGEHIDALKYYGVDFIDVIKN
jgi:arginine/lysine/ornithine decarboxylase